MTKRKTVQNYKLNYDPNNLSFYWDEMFIARIQNKLVNNLNSVWNMFV